MKYPKTDAIAVDSNNRATTINHRRSRGQRIVIENAFWSASVGLVPVPLVDVVGITAIQLKMINELSIEYGVTFNRNRAKALITALSSGVGIYALSALKLIPGIGSSSGSVGVSLTAGAITYAVGTLFVEHFEVGGTLGDLDIESGRERMKDLAEEGKQVVAEQQKAQG